VLVGVLGGLIKRLDRFARRPPRDIPRLAVGTCGLRIVTAAASSPPRATLVKRTLCGNGSAARPLGPVRSSFWIALGAVPPRVRGDGELVRQPLGGVRRFTPACAGTATAAL
jgi:hypothetical protein